MASAATEEQPISMEDFLKEAPVDFSWIERLLDEGESPTSSPSEKSNIEGIEAAIAIAIATTTATTSSEEPEPNFRESALFRWMQKPEAQAAFTDSPINSSRMSPMAESLWTDNISSVDSSLPLCPAPGVYAYANPLLQGLGNAFFFIDGGFPDWQSEVSLRSIVLDPSNSPVAVFMAREQLPFSSRIICSFFAALPGVYTVSVCDGRLNLNVQGSPFTLCVSRNYHMQPYWLKPRLLSSNETKSWGIAYSKLTQQIYVADRDGHQISVYSGSGVFQKKFGSPGSAPGTFYRPTGIAVDNINNSLVITDKDNHRVCIYTLDGQFILTFGGKGYKNGEFDYPWGVAVSPKDSSIAIADSRNHRIQIFDCLGNFLRKFSVFETNPFEYKTEMDYPRGVAFDMTGDNLFVTDFNVQAILKLDAALTEKKVITLQGVSLIRPQGIAIDPVGNLLVCDSRNNIIRVVSPQGDLITSIPGNALHSFACPQDLAILPTGEIVVVDSKSKVTVV